MTDIDPTEPGEASTALVQTNPEAHAVVASAMASIGMPSPAEWAALSGMSQQLARSSLVPRGLQGRPDDVMLILLTGRDLQIAPTQALNKVHVIEGKPTIAPELMVALVRRAGFPVWPGEDNDRTKATAHAEREGRRYSFTFTIEEAAQAGLCSIKDGQPFARSSTGKPLPWETYTRFMLWARAVSGLCRQVFPDVLMGVSYVPEELGATVDAQGDVIEANAYGPVTPTLDQLARQDGWEGVVDWENHRDELDDLLAKLDKLDPTVRPRWERWIAKEGIRLNPGTKSDWQQAYDKAAEKLAERTAPPAGSPGGSSEPADNISGDSTPDYVAPGEPITADDVDDDREPPEGDHHDLDGGARFETPDPARLEAAQASLLAAQAVHEGTLPVSTVLGLRDLTDAENTAAMSIDGKDARWDAALAAVAALKPGEVSDALAAAGISNGGPASEQKRRLTKVYVLGMQVEPVPAGEEAF